MIRGVITAKSKPEVLAKIKANKMLPISIDVKKIKKPAVPKQKIDYEKLQKIAGPNLQNKKMEHKNLGNSQKKMKFASLLTSDVSFGKGVKPKDVLVLTNSLYILKKAKFNNMTALESLYNSTENKKLRDIVEEIMIGADAGEMMYTVMAKYPKVFPPLYTNFVRVGEESGSLDIALEYARDYMESSMKLRKTIKGILLPKILMFLFVMVGMMVALLYGTPLIENVYEMFGSNKELPGVTKVAIKIAKWITTNWYIVLGAIVGIIIAIRAYIITPRGRYVLDRSKIKFPVFGRLYLNILTNKFFQAMLLNMKNGLRIQDSLEISKTLTNNYYFLALIETGKNNLLSGGSWVEPFEREGAFSPMTVEMLDIGMKTDLVEMMEKIAQYVEEEINESIEKTIKALPEIMYVFIGVMLVFFVITVMMPLIDVYMGGFLMESM